MSLNHFFILGLGFIALAGCSGRSVAVGQNRLDSLIPKTVALQTEQNTEISYDLNPSPLVFTDAQAEIVTAPQKGTVTFNGSTFEYQPDAYESGSDSFAYRLRSLGLTSSPAEVVVQIDPFVAGPYSYTENYAGGAFDLTGWTSHSSNFGHATSPTYGFSTNTYTFNGAAVDLRTIGVSVTPNTYGGDALYNQLFSNLLPVDGGGGAMYDWPWAADLIKLPKCFHEVEMITKIRYISAAPLVNLLLNYRIQSTNNVNYLTGYQLLVNSGGNTVTLSKFSQAHERAMAYMDRWPRLA